jgi:hypothetical protein
VINLTRAAIRTTSFPEQVRELLAHYDAMDDAYTQRTAPFRNADGSGAVRAECFAAYDRAVDDHRRAAGDFLDVVMAMLRAAPLDELSPDVRPVPAALADEFTNAFSEDADFVEEIAIVMCCTQATVMARVLSALGSPDAAAHWIDAHASDDTAEGAAAHHRN